MRNDGKYSFIGLGEILWDILPTETHLGGAPANFAYHAHALGANAVIVSAVGDDAQGKKILKKLQAMKLTTKYIATDPDHPTGSVTVDIDKQGNPTYQIHENSAWDFIPFSSKLNELAGNADVICFGSLAQRRQTSRDTIQSVLKSAKPDSLRIFDVNTRQNFYSKQILEESLQAANILKINTKELQIIAELLKIKGDERSLLQNLLTRCDLSLIALTRGYDGSTLLTAERIANHRGYHLKPLDTVGAGDAFLAALAWGLINGLDLDLINNYANHIAGYVCTKTGATPLIPQKLRCI